MSEHTPQRTRAARIRTFLRDLGFVLLAVVLVGVWQTRSLAEGDAPAFSGTAVGSATPPSLEAALAKADGRPLLLHFWASWCGVCDMMDSTIHRLAESQPVLTVAYQSGVETAVAQHMRQKQLDFPTVVDSAGQIGQLYGVNAVPTTFIIKPNGQIAFRSVGYSTSWGLRARLWLASRFAFF